MYFIDLIHRIYENLFSYILSFIAICTIFGCNYDENNAVGMNYTGHLGIGGKSTDSINDVRSIENKFMRILGNGEHLDILESNSLLDFPTETNQITIECWIRIREISNWMTIISSGNQNDFALAINQDQNTGLNLYSILYPISYIDDVGLKIDAWQHIAYTYDETHVKYFLNGNLIVSCLKNQKATRTPQPEDIRIGAYFGFGKINADINADFDEIRIWKISRTDKQIKNSLYCLKSEDKIGLIGHWQFEGNFEDSTPFKNHGQPIKSPLILKGGIK